MSEAVKGRVRKRSRKAAEAAESEAEALAQPELAGLPDAGKAEPSAPKRQKAVADFPLHPSVESAAAAAASSAAAVAAGLPPASDSQKEHLAETVNPQLLKSIMGAAAPGTDTTPAAIEQLVQTLLRGERTMEVGVDPAALAADLGKGDLMAALREDPSKYPDMLGAVGGSAAAAAAAAASSAVDLSLGAGGAGGLAASIPRASPDGARRPRGRPRGSRTAPKASFIADFQLDFTGRDPSRPIEVSALGDRSSLVDDSKEMTVAGLQAAAAVGAKQEPAEPNSISSSIHLHETGDVYLASEGVPDWLVGRPRLRLERIDKIKRLPWTQSEDDAIRFGLQNYGAHWSLIYEDPRFRSRHAYIAWKACRTTQEKFIRQKLQVAIKDRYLYLKAHKLLERDGVPPPVDYSMGRGDKAAHPEGRTRKPRRKRGAKPLGAADAAQVQAAAAAAGLGSDAAAASPRTSGPDSLPVDMPGVTLPGVEGTDALQLAGNSKLADQTAMAAAAAAAAVASVEQQPLPPAAEPATAASAASAANGSGPATAAAAAAAAAAGVVQPAAGEAHNIASLAAETAERAVQDALQSDSK